MRLTTQDDPVKVETDLGAPGAAQGMDDHERPADLPRPAYLPLPQARVRRLRSEPRLPSYGLGPKDPAVAEKLVRRDVEDDPLIADGELPGHLQRLAEGARVVRGEEISRFLPPESGGRPSAVLMLFGERARRA